MLGGENFFIGTAFVLLPFFCKLTRMPIVPQKYTLIFLG